MSSTETTELAIVYRESHSLKPYEKNSRTHSAEQIAQVVRSIQTFGWTNPILVNADGLVLAGHARLAAAKTMGMDRVPTIALEGMTPDQARAYIIADNKLALNAGWDEEVLAEELRALSETELDLSVIGFSEDELDAMIGNDLELGDEDDNIPALEADAVTITGDVWIMGRHRVVCGDCTDPKNWEALSIGPNALCFTSPPYNLGESVGLRSKKQAGSKNNESPVNAYDIMDDNQTQDEWLTMTNKALELALSSCAGVVFNVQPLAGNKRAIHRFIADNDHYCDTAIWDKGAAAPQMAQGVMANRYEWIAVFNPSGKSRKIPLSSWKGTVHNVYHGPPQRDYEFSKVHKATFPVHLPFWVITQLCNTCASVVDCFMGTGSTMIAAERAGRSSYGIELSPQYVDLIARRFQDFTGGVAMLEATGQTFDEVAAERSKATCSESE